MRSTTTRETVDRVAALDDRLRRQGVAGVVDSSTLTRALYSSDASLYRVVPQAVARPHTEDELVAVLAAAAAEELPVTTRGAGTSIAGNAVGPGLIVDVGRHLQKIVAIDPDRRTAVVQPGVVPARLTAQAARYGLRFGPDPSTHARCTIGGMIGNNACGPRALGYGRTADNVVALDVVTGSGDVLRLGDGTTRGSHPQLAALGRVVDGGLGTIRTEFGRFPRQVSGYSLEQLLPENRFQVSRFLVGTEGTLAVTTRATVRLVRDAPHRVMVALGYASMADAADAVPALRDFSPTACEGLDRRIVDVIITARGPAAVPPLPRGDGWMLVELVGEDAGEVRSRADGLLAAAGALDGFAVTDPVAAAALWRIREDGAGLAGVSLPTAAYAGWEDAAVPPARLGAYLRDFEALLAERGLKGLPYGHFGDGCVHVRIDFPLTMVGGSRVYREFVQSAADLVAGYGGSMSGEHGDGRARSALLPRMYSPEALDLFARVKGVLDPQNRLNPGVLVDPNPIDRDLRAVALVGRDTPFARDVHRCTGVGKCLVDATSTLGVMCPSFVATREEKDSTRGRARVLQEMVNGELVDGWRSPEVHEALDLCLSCKGCARDCPTGIDMASYKSQVLDQTWRRRLRPRAHYALGWLPRWGRLITRTRVLAPLVNAATAAPGLRSLVRWSAGIDQRRSLPRFASRPAGARVPAAPPAAPDRPQVVVWVDSFSDCFPGDAVAATLTVLRAAGYAPRLLERSACCGLTWISTGQREGARRQLRNALDVLHPIAAAGTPIVGLEPSCTAVWRDDAAALLPDDPRVPVVRDAVRTLAEVLTGTPDWTPPDLSGVELVVQPHCHHASVLGWNADADLLAGTGATVTALGGCCGLAGNFGVERGHYDVSVAIAEHDLLPAVRARPDAVVLADGFSCRTQLAELAGRSAVTLAELLAGHPAPRPPN